MNFVRAFINLFQFNRTNWKAVVLCFLAASVFWLFNAFNKRYSTDLQFPLKFEYDQSKYVPQSPLQPKLKLNVSGSGWELFRSSVGFKLPHLIIPVERPAELKKIVANSLVPVLAGQVGGLQINYVVADTLHLNLDARKVRTFFIGLDENSISFRQGFGINGAPQISPSIVELDGPASIIDKLPDTILAQVPAKDLRNDFNDEVEVPFFANEFIKRNPPLVKVKFDVVPVKEVAVRLKVRVVNAGSFRTFTNDSVRAVCKVPTQLVDDLKDRMHSMEAVVDLSDAQRGTIKRLPVITGLPDYVNKISVDTLTVKVN